MMGMLVTQAADYPYLTFEATDGNKISVKVGSVEHPMTEAHLIEWILLRTDKGNQRKTLAPGLLTRALQASAKQWSLTSTRPLTSTT